MVLSVTLILMFQLARVVLVLARVLLG